MKDYQYISVAKVFLLYLIALLPTWIILLKKSTYSNKEIFKKRNYLLIFIEIIIFGIIYYASEKFIFIFSNKTNIQNYMIYSLKILFIASSTTVLHYSIPLFFYFFYKKFKLIFCFLKFLYIPIILISFFIFNIKGALFAVPLCDILYNIFLIFKFEKGNSNTK